MYLVWFLIALPVWTLTILSYRWAKPWVFQQVPNRSVMKIATVSVSLVVLLGIIAFFRAVFT
jgi:hypothetical protein